MLGLASSRVSAKYSGSLVPFPKCTPRISRHQCRRCAIRTELLNELKNANCPEETCESHLF